jgi:hypothetical protein
MLFQNVHHDEYLRNILEMVAEIGLTVFLTDNGLEHREDVSEKTNLLGRKIVQVVVHRHQLYLESAFL